MGGCAYRDGPVSRPGLNSRHSYGTALYRVAGGARLVKDVVEPRRRSPSDSVPTPRPACVRRVVLATQSALG